MQAGDLHKFEFLAEVSKDNTYRLLFPEKRIGMAIIWLYIKIQEGSFPNGVFNESDIYQALEEVNPSRDNASRHQWENYGSSIAELQEYFLRYDNEKRVYTFKEYAYEFCSRAYDILKADFDPTQIEKICFELRDRLYAFAEGGRILDWFSMYYETYKPKLKQQIDFLDRQIDHSVLELRKNLSRHQEGIVEILGKVDFKMEQIRKQNNELKAAFREINNIKSKLEQYSLETTEIETGDLIYEAVIFFQDMKKVLSLIDRRLDRIQPKIRQLFSSLNQPRFNNRFESFLRYLLDRSVLQINGSKKTLLFPLGLTPPILHGPVPEFTIVERKKDLFPAKAKQKPAYAEDLTHRTESFRHSQIKLVQHDIVSVWLQKIKDELQSHKMVNFSSFFFRILAEKEDKLEVAILVAHAVIKEAHQNNWRLNIIPEKVIETDKNVALWEMIIRDRA